MIACMVDLALSIGRGSKQELHLRNPVMTASGTFSNGLEFARRFDLDALGALVSKGTTLRPRKGQPAAAHRRDGRGMINSIGFQNIGVGALVREVAPMWARWGVPVLVNIMGDTVDEFGQLAERLDGVPGVAGLEVNISCPNVEVGGMEFGQDPVARGEGRARRAPLDGPAVHREDDAQRDRHAPDRAGGRPRPAPTRSRS